MSFSIPERGRLFYLPAYPFSLSLAAALHARLTVNQVVSLTIPLTGLPQVFLHTHTQQAVEAGNDDHPCFTPFTVTFCRRKMPSCPLPAPCLPTPFHGKFVWTLHTWQWPTNFFLETLSGLWDYIHSDGTGMAFFPH